MIHYSMLSCVTVWFKYVHVDTQVMNADACDGSLRVPPTGTKVARARRLFLIINSLNNTILIDLFCYKNKLINLFLSKNKYLFNYRTE